MAGAGVDDGMKVDCTCIPVVVGTEQENWKQKS